MQEQRWWHAWVGLPSMIGLLAFIAAASAISGLGGLITAILGVLVIYLTIGLAMTLANKR